MSRSNPAQYRHGAQHQVGGLCRAQSGHKGIAGLSVRSSRGVLVEDNRIINNYVARDSRWPGKGLGPKGSLDLQGLPNQDMTDIVFRNNRDGIPGKNPLPTDEGIRKLLYDDTPCPPIDAGATRPPIGGPA